MKGLKLLFILLLISIKCLPQSTTATPNIGFENGTFDNWQCFLGGIDSLGNISLEQFPPRIYRQTLYGPDSARSLDPFGNFPVLCPNGSKYSMRLGNEQAQSEAERISYTFTVPNIASYSIIFDYAVVLNNPSHLPFQQPKFTAYIYDLTDNTVVSCPAFDFIASSSLPGFKLSKKLGPGRSPVYYKEWSSATIHLSGYQGKSIRLEFTTNDCSKGEHFGYAYIDVNENSDQAISGNAYCVGQKSVTLHAPIGFASYNWYTADLSLQVGQGINLTLSPPPPDNTTYALEVSPYEGLGCADTLYTTVNKIDEGFNLSVLDTVYGCPESGVDLTAARITAGSSAGMTYSYFTDSLATTFLYNPDFITVNGKYYIQGVNAEGCENILPIQVIMVPAQLSVTDPLAVAFPSTVDISKTYTPLPGYIYSYYTDSETNTPLLNYSAVGKGGTYYIKAQNSTGCVKVLPVNVVVTPPPPYEIAAPNTFTPNNDGINDQFAVTATGIITFVDVKIFNRYGQLMYTTRSPADHWDGRFNGKNVPSGAYYWIFEGTDDYYHKKVTRSGYITVIR